MIPRAITAYMIGDQWTSRDGHFGLSIKLHTLHTTDDAVEYIECERRIVDITEERNRRGQ